MKPLRLFLLVALVLLQSVLSLGMLSSVLARDVPPLTGRVNDTARILSPETIRLLNLSLQTLETNDSTQIVVLTIPSLEGDSLEGYALKVAEQWRIGQKGLDNGALLLVAVKDRKIRIEVGYGLEGTLTDLVAGRIIREKMVPAFRRGTYDQGVSDGVAAMIAAVRGEFAGKEASVEHGSSQDPGGFIALLIFGLLFIGKLFRGHKPLAVGLGGVFAPLLAGMVFAGLFSWLVVILLIPLGMFGALIATLLVGTGSIHRSGGIFPGMSGGFGGGFGGGGFSGGGGGFGGGGASGGW
jgi:uncharacterized protein